MSTHNICIRREIGKILCGYPLLSVAMVICLPHNSGRVISFHIFYFIHKKYSHNLFTLITFLIQTPNVIKYRFQNISVNIFKIK